MAQLVKESACNAGDPGSIPGSGRSPGEGNGNPLQHSCLENPTDRGAWRAVVHGVAKRHDGATNTNLKHRFVTPKNENSIKQIIVFIYLLGYPGSPFLLRLCPGGSEQGLLSSCGAWGSRCCGFSCWGAWALETMGFSSCGARACLPCGMWRLPR